ncbi:hypothetical protein C8R43DRAFT_215684 [Mycena crocata]|nr:hypothetical protein C8R43DRAFT_215684 [Mycena crocata]
MNHQSNAAPVPTSVTEFYASNSANSGQGPGYPQPAAPNQNSNRARAPQHSAPGFTAEGYYEPPRQHPVAYPHGIPTPPSRPIPLESQHESQHTTSSSPVAMFPEEGNSRAAYPTPPSRLSALSSPDGQRTPNRLPSLVPQLPSLTTVYAQRQPHASSSFSSQPPTPTDSRRPTTAPVPYPPPGTLPRRIAPSSSSSQLPTSTESRRPTSAPRPPTNPGSFGISPQSTLHRPTINTSSMQMLSSNGSQHPSMAQRAPPTSTMQTLPSPHNYMPVPNHSSFAIASTSQQLLPTAPGSHSQYRPQPQHTMRLQPNPHTPISDILQSTLAVHAEQLRDRVVYLENTVAETQSQLKASQNAAMDISRRALQAKDDAQKTEERLRAENLRLRGERDEARDLTVKYNQSLKKAHEVHAVLGGGLQAAQTVHLADQKSLKEMQDENKKLRETLRRLGNESRQRLERASREHVRLEQERDALKATVEGMNVDSSQEETVLGERQIKVEPDLTPKSELMDELDLQYPPDPSETESSVEPVASTSAGYDALTGHAAAADASTSSSVFVVWEPPPELDRKRSREEYEADGDGEGRYGGDLDADVRAPVRARLQEPSVGATHQEPSWAPATQGDPSWNPTQQEPSMGPTQMQLEPSLGVAFPIPIEMDVKTLNNPTLCFMEIRRKEGG